MPFTSVKQLEQAITGAQRPAWQTILLQDAQEQDITEEKHFARMQLLWETMCSASAQYAAQDHSASGMVGGDGQRMLDYAEQSIGGEYTAQVIAEALKMGECNACMKRIVAAPTAGSCGVLPAVLLPYYRKYAPTDEAMVQALYIAAAFGQVIASRACIAGAEGGCQAEVGSAAGMAAAALVYLRGGDINAMGHACAIALKNLLGLVCDPVAGLVEIPCVKRNVIGAMAALSSADMALAGIKSRIPPDEVIDAMREVGDALPSSLRETGRGGLAATPTGQQIAQEMFAHNHR